MDTGFKHKANKYTASSVMVLKCFKSRAAQSGACGTKLACHMVTFG